MADTDKKITRIEVDGAIYQIEGSNSGSNITIDTALSATSDNAIANKAVFEALSLKADSLNIPTDAHINELIDTKLGTIENGSY